MQGRGSANQKEGDGPRGSGGKSGSDLVEEVRLRDLSHVALFGNIQVSTQAIQSLCELEIPVTYFSMGGWFYGRHARARPQECIPADGTVPPGARRNNVPGVG
jgi:CRISPR/Cas system-associated endonuclease Cas1